jgi:predicted RNA-binding protein with PIN domain
MAEGDRISETPSVLTSAVVKRPKLYLIDGYNVIRRDPRLREIENRQGLEAGRAALVSQLKTSAVLASIRTTIVFDGSGDVVSPTPAGHPNLSIIFSTPPANADAKIVAMVQAHKTPEHITVVTSDQDLSWQLRSAGASVLSTENFEALRRPPGRKRAHPRDSQDTSGKPTATRSEVAWGLSVFGDDDTDR